MCVCSHHQRGLLANINILNSRIKPYKIDSTKLQLAKILSFNYVYAWKLGLSEKCGFNPFKNKLKKKTYSAQNVGPKIYTVLKKWTLYALKSNQIKYCNKKLFPMQMIPYQNFSTVKPIHGSYGVILYYVIVANIRHV